MKSLHFEPQAENLPKVRLDAVAGDVAFEVRTELRDARRLRAALMDMARMVATRSARRVFLVLEDPHITQPRLHEEWAGAAAVIRPDLLKQLSMAIYRSGEWTGIPVSPDKRELTALNEVLKRTRATRPVRSGRSAEAHYEILRILIHQWLLGKGPVAIHWLMETSGTSHPTVSRALERFDHCLKRHSDRSVELRYFPRDEWARLLAVADDVRATICFADRSGQPRSSEALLRRLRQLKQENIALGGVAGARHYQAAIDLVGNPRLDVSVHTAGKAVDLSFLKQIDPALEQTTHRDQSPVLVIHTLRRASSFFQTDKNGIPWADPVECLLDLHEARLESQALEFLNSFPAMKAMHNDGVHSV